MKNIISILSIAALLSMSASCKKNKDAHVPPGLSFKTGAGYTSGNVTIQHGDSVLVGVIITKEEDDLRTLNLSHAYDGATTTTTQFTYTMTAAEYTGFNHDYYIVSRNTPGTEQWIFTVTDRDGNLAQKGITLTVQ
jgi:hypothetical protein